MYSLLIADDDAIIREGIRKYLMKNFAQIDTVLTAKNGQEAFSIFEESKPDIIYTDVAMPIFDGLELIDRLHQNGYRPKAVVISAFENFSYAQNAMRLGVEDYLIKPIMPAQICSVTFKLLTELDQHQAFMRNIHNIMNTYQESLPVIRQRFFNILIQGNIDEPELINKARQADIDLTGKAFTVAVLKVVSPPFGIPGRLSAADGFSRFLSDANKELFPDGLHVYNFVDNGSNVVLIGILEREDTCDLFRQMNRSLNKLLASVRSRTELTIEKAALGRPYTHLDGISRSYQEAVDVLVSTDSTPANSVGNYTDISPSKDVGIKIDSVLENNLLHYVKYQTVDRCLSLVDQFEAQVSNCRNARLESIRAYLLQMTALMWREYQQLYSDRAEFQVDFDTLLGAENLDACLAWFRVFVRSLVTSYQRINAENGHWQVNRAKCIINDNIANSEFSLNDVAAALYVSTNYMRRLFRQQAGESFVEYLTRIRMEKAVDLLKNTTMKIQDIAEATGFSNQRYFAVCFKKHVGETPTSIREKAV